MREFDVERWVVQPDLNRLVRDDAEVRLEPRVMDLLVYLAERPGEVLSADQIVRDVWPEPYVGDNALLSAVSALRKAFGDRTRDSRIIATVPKRGYRFIARTSAANYGLAVLPFQAAAGATEEFLADGMTDALITELGKLRALRVISRQSSMAYKGSAKPLPEIARELNVRWIVEGAAHRSGSRVRISAALVDAANDAHLWTEAYDCQLKDTLPLQREIASRIAAAITDRLRRPAGDHAPSPQVQPDALVAYLRGRFHWWKFTPGHFDRALECFREAIRNDPGFAPAYAGVADVWGAYGYWGILPPPQVRKQVREAAAQAVEIDPSSAEAHLLWGGYAFYYEHDGAAAEARYRRAIELNPNLAHARVLHALLLAALNRAEAVDEMDLAIRLDPLNPGALLIKALWFGMHRRYQEARRSVNRLLEIDAQHPPGLQLLADLCWLTGDPGALALERQLWVRDKVVKAALTAARPAVPARRSMARAAEVLEARAAVQYVQPTQIARLWVHGGEPEAALACLERAAACGHLIQMDLLKLSPAWNPLRRRRRFRSLLARLGFPY